MDNEKDLKQRLINAFPSINQEKAELLLEVFGEANTREIVEDAELLLIKMDKVIQYIMDKGRD